MSDTVFVAGLDVGSGAVKAVVMAAESGGEPRLLSSHAARIRRRQQDEVISEAFGRAVSEAGVDRLDYVATTGEGEDVPFATGHFYGMTAHARGALWLCPEARAVMDVGALHARAISMDARGKVLAYKMTSQCASGSGQFLENIARYLGVSLAEVGSLSQTGAHPERVSSICAVLAETDVINMVSRGVSTPDILRGIHESMAGRFARLLRSLPISGTIFVSGGPSADSGLIAALNHALAEGQTDPATTLRLATDPLGIFAGAIGAAAWGTVRHAKLELRTPAWTRDTEPGRPIEAS